MADVIKTGVIGTEALLSTNVKPDVEQVLKVLEPYRKPFSSWLFLNKRKSKVVNSQYAKFEWFEQHFYPHLTNVTAAISLTGATLILSASNVGNKDIFNLYDTVIIDETSQMAYVSSVTGGGGADIILTHMDGSSSLTALTSGTGNIRIIGTRVFGYHGRIESKQLQEVNVYNYLNEFVRYVKTDGRQEAGQAYTDGEDHTGRVQRKIKEMQLEIERYFWWANNRGYATSGNTRTTYGYGIDGYLSTNVEPYTGAVTEDGFRGYLRTVMMKGSGKKVHFANSYQMEDIEKFINDKYTIMQAPKEMSTFAEFGATAKTFRIFSGTVTLVWDPVLDDTNGTKGAGYTLDEENVLMRYMAPDKVGSRKMSVRTTTDPDVRGTETEILFDVGIELDHESTHGKYYQS